MLKFQPMTEEEFTAFKAWMIEDYAKGIADNYHRTIEEARSSSSKQLDELLSQGLLTPHNFLYNIVLSGEDGDSRIGYLWIDANEERKRCWIAEIYLHEQYRHKGLGRKSLELLEEEMKKRSITSIGLHVFADNQVAQELYKDMGYRLTGWNMQKWLDE